MREVLPKSDSRWNRMRSGIVEYWLNVVYLSMMLAAFVQYRRFLLAAHNIEFLQIGLALIKALILAKVIMIGESLRIGQTLKNRPLIIPVLYKTAFFTMLVAAFTAIEEGIRGLINGDRFIGAISHHFGNNHNEVLADSLMTLIVFLPFFAVKELARVLGSENIRALFFKHRPKGE